MSKTRCPICRQPSDPANAPFCSRRCVDRDLLQWFGEGYRIPARPSDDGLDSAPDRS